MILAVDIGNTNITSGLYDENGLRRVVRLATDRNKMPDQYAADFSAILALHNIETDVFDGAVIGSVVPELTNTLKTAIKFVTKKTPMILGPGLKTGLNIMIDNPAQLGSDLVAGAVGAIAGYETPLLILDLGTATKMSVIDSKSRFRGCVIAPGVKLSLSALSSGASQLPSISLEAPDNAIGTNTVASMQSGVVLGTACMLEGMCRRLEESLGEKIKTIIATGGISADIIKYCRVDAVNDPNLVLDGLKIIYDKNSVRR